MEELSGLDCLVNGERENSKDGFHSYDKSEEKASE